MSKCRAPGLGIMRVAASGLEDSECGVRQSMVERRIHTATMDDPRFDMRMAEPTDTFPV